MIDPKSLRIGNRILYEQNSIEFTVIGIDRNGFEVENEEERTWIESDQFAGIPLSPSLLERAGFKRILDEFHDEIWEHNDKSLIRFWNYNNEGYVFESYDGHPPIKWFHDLQNLFRDLTGQELELKP